MLEHLKDGETRLREKGVMEVEIIEIPAASTVVDIRKMGQLSGIRSGICGRRSDYLVVNDEGGRDRAVFVELKKTLDEDLSDGMDQLRQSRPLLDYLHSVCRVHFGADFLSSDMIVRYCLIGEQLSSRIRKEPTRVRRPWRVEMYRDIKVAAFVGSIVRFDELWSGV